MLFYGLSFLQINSSIKIVKITWTYTMNIKHIIRYIISYEIKKLRLKTISISHRGRNKARSVPQKTAWKTRRKITKQNEISAHRKRKKVYEKAAVDFWSHCLCGALVHLQMKSLCGVARRQCLLSLCCRRGKKSADRLRLFNGCWRLRRCERVANFEGCVGCRFEMRSCLVWRVTYIIFSSKSQLD